MQQPLIVFVFLRITLVMIGAACAPASSSTLPTATVIAQPTDMPKPTSAPAATSAPKPTTALIVSGKLPRVFSSDPQALAESKAKFAAGDKLVAGTVDWLLFEANRALRFEPVSVMDKKIAPPSNDKHDYMSMAPYWWPNPSTPNGLPYIRKDGQTNPEIHSVPDKDALVSLSANVYTLALAYYFSGDEKYAEGATKLIRVWFLNADTKMNPHVKYGQSVRGVNDGRAESILETRNLARVVDAVGLIAESKNWTTSDQQGLTKWFSDFTDWMTTDPIGREERAAVNNHGTWYDAQLVTYLLFLGKNDDAKKVLEDARSKRIDTQIEPDGKMPRETERADAWHYTVFNLDAFFTLAMLGDRAGVDLWNYATTDGRSIRKALDYLVRFIVDEKWPHSSSADMSWNDIFLIVCQVAVKYGATNYQQIGNRIPTVDAATTRANLLLPPFVASAIQATPTIAAPKPTTVPPSTPLVICNFEDDISIWQGYSQDSEMLIKVGEKPPVRFLSDAQLFAASLNRWYQPMPGFEKSTEQVKEGKSAGKWANVVKNNRIVAGNIPHDWSAYQYISFWVYSAEANRSSVTFVAYSEKESTQENYYRYKITLDWTGWKLFEIAFKEFTVTREPVGWHKIDSLKFASTGWSQTPYSAAVLYFDAMKLTNARE